MSALDSLFLIANNDLLVSYDFKYCFVNENKLPFKIDGTLARPNHVEDFSDIYELSKTDEKILNSYKGLGISVQASNVCAIDIDNCVDNEFDVNSINALASNIIDIFKDFAYIEFSFSGRGLRIFFKTHKIDDYQSIYYIKNSKFGIEFYYPEGSARYVTITGKSIVNNIIKSLDEKERSKLISFLNTYMKREYTFQTKEIVEEKDDRSTAELMKIVKMRYLTNSNFQDLWFSKAPGSGHDESERDYHLVAELYENITHDRNKIKQIFEESQFYKSKDWKHINKWTKNDFRYFNYLYDRIRQKENR